MALSEEAKRRQYEAHDKYDREHTRKVMLKFNKKHDADILQKLGEVGNMQGYIKTLIRADMAMKTT